MIFTDPSSHQKKQMFAKLSFVSGAVRRGDARCKSRFYQHHAVLNSLNFLYSITPAIVASQGEEVIQSGTCKRAPSRRAEEAANDASPSQGTTLVLEVNPDQIRLAGQACDHDLHRVSSTVSGMYTHAVTTYDLSLPLFSYRR